MHLLYTNSHGILNIYKINNIYGINVYCISSLKNHLYYSLRFSYYHWVDASAGGLLVPEGITSPVASTSVLA